MHLTGLLLGLKISLALGLDFKNVKMCLDSGHASRSSIFSGEGNDKCDDLGKIV